MLDISNFKIDKKKKSSGVIPESTIKRRDDILELTKSKSMAVNAIAEKLDLACDVVRADIRVLIKANLMVNHGIGQKLFVKAV